jgi:hypothetical protein
MNFVSGTAFLSKKCPQRIKKRPTDKTHYHAASDETLSKKKAFESVGRF